MIRKNNYSIPDVLANPGSEIVTRLSDFGEEKQSDLEAKGLKAISEGKLAIILDFSPLDQKLQLETLKIKHKPKWPLDVSFVQYCLQKIKSLGKHAVSVYGKNYETERDPILVLIQCNDYNLEEIDEYLVKNRYFGYQGLICFPIVRRPP